MRHDIGLTYKYTDVSKTNVFGTFFITRENLGNT